jgi:hypothetical protein
MEMVLKRRFLGEDYTIGRLYLSDFHLSPCPSPQGRGEDSAGAMMMESDFAMENIMERNTMERNTMENIMERNTMENIIGENTTATSSPPPVGRRCVVKRIFLPLHQILIIKCILK